MAKYIGKRLLQLIPVLLGITFLTFALMHAAGSDAITEMYADKGAVSQEIIDAKKAELGLDKPFIVQYFTWLGGMLTGDMGVSYVSGKNIQAACHATFDISINCLNSYYIGSLGNSYGC